MFDLLPKIQYELDLYSSSYLDKNYRRSKVSLLLDLLRASTEYSLNNKELPNRKNVEKGTFESIGNEFNKLTNKNMFETLFYNKSAPILSALNTSELFDLVTTLSSGIPGLAEGGRINYAEGPKDPRRRTFMKAAAGLASLLPFGAAKIVGKAAPVVAKAAEITGPALAKIVDTVMSLGKLVSVKGRKVKEMVTKKKHEGVEVTEDIQDQSFIIKKGDKEIYYKPGKMDETGGIEDDIIEVIEKRIQKAGGGGIGYMLGE
mgnify:CR=1 FL=1